MARGGKMVYVPNKALREVEEMIKSRKAENRSDAFRIMTDQAKIGQEMDRIHKSLFGIKDKRKKRK